MFFLNLSLLIKLCKETSHLWIILKQILVLEMGTINLKCDVRSLWSNIVQWCTQKLSLFTIIVLHYVDCPFIINLIQKAVPFSPPLFRMCVLWERFEQFNHWNGLQRVDKWMTIIRDVCIWMRVSLLSGALIDIHTNLKSISNIHWFLSFKTKLRL